MSLQRFDEIKALIEAKRTAEARPRLEKLLNETRVEKDLRAEGFCRLYLTMVSLGNGDLIEAQVALRRGAETLLEADDYISAALAFSAIGSVEAALWRLDAAIAAHERSLRLLHDHDASRVKLDGIPLFDPLNGPVGASRELVELHVSDAYVKAFILAGQVGKAEAELSRTKLAATRHGGVYQALLLTNDGDLRRLQLRFDDARESYLSHCAPASRS
jgi:tetratricopeptide (TPR) repeat protein